MKRLINTRIFNWIILPIITLIIYVKKATKWIIKNAKKKDFPLYYRIGYTKFISPHPDNQSLLKYVVYGRFANGP